MVSGGKEVAKERAMRFGWEITRWPGEPVSKLGALVIKFRLKGPLMVAALAPILARGISNDRMRNRT